MKKLFIVLFILLFASTVMAWDISWDAVPNAEGYLVSYNDLATPLFIMVDDVGSATNRSLDDLGLIEGTRYEFWVNAYASGSTSGDSDHVRWTYPRPPLVIETLGAPVSIIINP